MGHIVVLPYEKCIIVGCYSVKNECDVHAVNRNPSQYFLLLTDNNNFEGVSNQNDWVLIVPDGSLLANRFFITSHLTALPWVLGNTWGSNDRMPYVQILRLICDIRLIKLKWTEQLNVIITKWNKYRIQKCIFFKTMGMEGCLLKKRQKTKLWCQFYSRYWLECVLFLTDAPCVLHHMKKGKEIWRWRK